MLIPLGLLLLQFLVNQVDVSRINKKQKAFIEEVGQRGLQVLLCGVREGMSLTDPFYPEHERNTFA